jgi:S1-C subfamily serine protease
MYQNAIDRIKQSIFPIFFEVHHGNQFTIGVSGTGFFIDNKGHFITAHHTTTDVPPGAKLRYLGNVPDHVVQPVDITEVYSDPARDIFLGRIDMEYQQPVTLSFDKSRPGKNVCLCGYPFAQIGVDGDGVINVANVRQYWQPTFVIDSISAQDNGRTYNGFTTQNPSLNGMSGGPVFDHNGIVYGVDVARLTRESPMPGKPPMIVENGVVIGNDTILDIYQKIGLG